MRSSSMSIRRKTTMAAIGAAVTLAALPSAALAETPSECVERVRQETREHFQAIEDAGWGSPHYALARGLIRAAACYS